MARMLGLLLGGLMLVNSITDTISPRFGFRVWERYLRPFMPKSVNEDVNEYARLSDSALRYVSVWELCVALTMLWLASRARD